MPDPVPAIVVAFGVGPGHGPFAADLARLVFEPDRIGAGQGGLVLAGRPVNDMAILMEYQIVIGRPLGRAADLHRAGGFAAGLVGGVASADSG